METDWDDAMSLVLRNVKVYEMLIDMEPVWSQNVECPMLSGFRCRKVSNVPKSHMLFAVAPIGYS